MAIQRVYRTTRRTPEEVARDKAVRDYFQEHKPTVEDLEADGGVFVPMHEVMRLRRQGREPRTPDEETLSRPD